MHSRALELLRERYGVPEPFSLASPWQTAAAVVLHQGRRTPLDRRDWDWLPDSPLSSAEQTATLSAAVLGRLLEEHGHPPGKAVLLLKLARMWVRRLKSGQDPLAASEESKVALHKSAGLSLETADLVLLLAGRRRVFPIGRGTQRIACRHGWLDPGAEYEDWQAEFCRGVDDPAEIEQLWTWLSRTAQEFCGPIPHCEQCPLQELLPQSGPIPLGE